ncbi:hypothetical protein Z517_03724 [Fonsecaea pedrosoi CBS 271.37]|uniref:Unplaced genomic scaffold supercont1.2, whole genome shotgun sequence n=1 Tax=Fonsecaea pedrosoi CBS 271.37 TaxID=1442368 RepID=A0A0D2HJ69_9EURO|nr:uncharacterized protein Z517_03724 [Fonsecaea pedrosoi CBS 271.37]KIW84474.1 hypothetical protein Z517_03724 [Fonsecaea pedrosoi CBS 271.37]
MWNPPRSPASLLKSRDRNFSKSFEIPPRRPIITPRRVRTGRLLNIGDFESELSEFPFLSKHEKVHPPAPQTFESLYRPRLRRYPTCQNVRVEELIDDHGMEGYIFKVNIDGDGPFALKVVSCLIPCEMMKDEYELMYWNFRKFKQVHRPPRPHIWPFLRESLFYSRAEAVNASVLNGKSLPEGPPPEPYTLDDMLRFLRSFSSDHDTRNQKGKDDQAPNTTESCKILSDMDGSLGWIRLNHKDMNYLIRKWELDVGFTMNGAGFQDDPFGIVKKLVVSNAPLDPPKIVRWLDLASYLGFDLSVFEPRNWLGEGILVDSGDVLTLPFQGKWQIMAQSHKTLRAKFQAEVS